MMHFGEFIDEWRAGSSMIPEKPLHYNRNNNLFKIRKVFQKIDRKIIEKWPYFARLAPRSFENNRKLLL